MPLLSFTIESKFGGGVDVFEIQGVSIGILKNDV